MENNYIIEISPLSPQKYDYVFKCIISGNSGTGKTSLTKMYTEKTFNADVQSTIGYDFQIKQFFIGNTAVKLQIWDTAGQERFRAIPISTYRGSHGVILVYDLADPKSAEDILIWYEEINKYAKEGIPIVLVGNKSDLETLQNKELCPQIQETRTIISQFLLSHSEIVNHYVCSAKQNENVDELFIGLTKAMIQDNLNNHHHNHRDIERNSYQIISPQNTQTNCC